MGIPRFWADSGANPANGSVGTAKLAAGAVTNAKVADDAAIAGSKLQALSVGENAGVVPSTGIANAHVAADAAISGSKLAANAQVRQAISDVISLTNEGAVTVSKAILHTTKAITITAVRLIFEAASDTGSVPNVEVGINGSLESVVAAVAVGTEQAQWTATAMTIASGAVAADKTVIVSTVAGGATTNTGAVRIAIEYTVNDAA